MVRTKRVPRRRTEPNEYRLSYYDNILRRQKMGKRKNNMLYAYIYRKINKRYANNKTNRKKNRVNKRRKQYALTKIEYLPNLYNLSNSSR